MDFDNSFDVISPDIQPTITIGGTAGLVLPSGTVAQRASTTNGTLRFNTDGGAPEVYVTSQYFYMRVSPSLVTTGIAAAGTAYNTATALVSDFNVVASASGSSTGVSLPAATIPQLYGRVVSIYNDTSTLLQVYPQAGGTIDGQSANAPVQVAAGKTIAITQLDSTRWATAYNTGTSGGGGGAPTGASYITLATDSTLSGERVLQGTTNQISITDGGANGNVTIGIPANPRVDEGIILIHGGFWGDRMEIGQGMFGAQMAMIQTSGYILSLRQVGATLGMSSINLVNETGILGANVTNESSTAAVDLGFKMNSTSYVGNIRHEQRSANVKYSANHPRGEFQINIDTKGTMTTPLAVGDNTVGILSSNAYITGNLTIGTTGTNTATILSALSANGSAGSAGQVLTSRGPGLSPQWTSGGGGGGGTVTAGVIGVSLDSTVPNGRTLKMSKSFTVVDEGVGKQLDVYPAGAASTWVSATITPTCGYSAIAVNDTIGVAVGGSGCICFDSQYPGSTNPFVSRLSPANMWTDVEANGSVFMAVGYNNGSLAVTASRSIDGWNWTTLTLPALTLSGSAVTVARVPSTSTWVINPGSNTSVLTTSNNGGTWSTVSISSLAVTSINSGIFYANSTLIIPQIDGYGTAVMTISTTSGASWSNTNVSAQVPDAQLFGVTGDETGFIIISGAGIIYTSTNGTTWTQVASNLQEFQPPSTYYLAPKFQAFTHTLLSYYDNATSTNRYIISGANRRFVEDSDTALIVASSLSSWTTISTTKTIAQNLKDVAVFQNGSTLVGVCDGAGGYSTTHPVCSASSSKHPVLSAYPWSTVGNTPQFAFGPVVGSMSDDFLATLSAPSAYLPSVLMFWSPRTSMSAVTGQTITVSLTTPYNVVGYGSGLFVLLPSSVGVTGLHVTATSLMAHATSFSSFTIPTAKNWTGIAYGSAGFVAINNVDSVGLLITDALACSTITLPTIGSTWKYIYYFGTQYVAVPVTGTAVHYSSDGITWTASGTLPSSGPWFGMAYGNGVYVLTGTGSTYYTSTDLITWTAGTLPITNAFITFAGGWFIISGVISPKYRSASGANGSWTTDMLVPIDVVNGTVTNISTVDDVAIIGYNVNSLCFALPSTYAHVSDSLSYRDRSIPTAAIRAYDVDTSVSGADTIGMAIVSDGTSARWSPVEQVKRFPIYVDFGNVPVYSKTFKFDATTILPPSITPSPTVTPVTIAASSNVLQGDELEMDNFVCAAGYSSSTHTLTLCITALPGPVKGIRAFSLVL